MLFTVWWPSEVFSRFQQLPKWMVKIWMQVNKHYKSQICAVNWTTRCDTQVLKSKQKVHVAIALVGILDAAFNNWKLTSCPTQAAQWSSFTNCNFVQMLRKMKTQRNFQLAEQNTVQHQNSKKHPLVMACLQSKWECMILSFCLMQFEQSIIIQVWAFAEEHICLMQNHNFWCCKKRKLMMQAKWEKVVLPKCCGKMTILLNFCFQFWLKLIFRFHWCFCWKTCDSLLQLQWMQFFFFLPVRMWKICLWKWEQEICAVSELFHLPLRCTSFCIWAPCRFQFIILAWHGISIGPVQNHFCLVAVTLTVWWCIVLNVSAFLNCGWIGKCKFAILACVDGKGQSFYISKHFRLENLKNAEIWTPSLWTKWLLAHINELLFRTWCCGARTV